MYSEKEDFSHFQTKHHQLENLTFCVEQGIALWQK